MFVNVNSAITEKISPKRVIMDGGGIFSECGEVLEDSDCCWVGEIIRIG